MKNSDFIIIGASIIDVLAQPVDSSVFTAGSRPVDRIVMHTGGDALNEASVLSSLGGSVKLVSSIGCDAAGQYILSQCKDLNIDTSCFIKDSSIDTGINIVLVEKDGERSFLTNPNGSLRKLRPADVTDDVLEGGHYLSFASIFVSPEFDCRAMARLFSRAKEKGLIVCADMTKCKNGETIQDMSEAFRYLDYIFPNYEEARLLTGLSDWDEIADAFLSCGVKHVIIKAGERGCFIKTPDSRFWADAYPGARCIDTTGAGDTFTACFLYALNSGLTLYECGKFANAGASLCIEQIGAAGVIKDAGQVWDRVK